MITGLQTIAGRRHRSRTGKALSSPCFLGQLGFRTVTYPTEVG